MVTRQTHSWSFFTSTGTQANTTHLDIFPQGLAQLFISEYEGK